MRTVIEPISGWRPIDWRELARYRDLFRFLVLRTVRTRYAQSVLGVGWAVVQPVFSMVVFTIVFGRLARISSDGAPYALFALVAVVPWTYFSAALIESTNSVVANAHMLGKVYFPRLVLPLAAVAAKLLDFAIAFTIALGAVLAAGHAPTTGLLVVPLLVAMMVCAAVGAGMWLTALAVQFRDVSYAANFLVQLLMYASPVVYPASLVPERHQVWYALNPMVGVIEGFRSALLGTNAMPWRSIGVGAAVAALLLVSGAMYFRRQEHLFADVT